MAEANKLYIKARGRGRSLLQHVLNPGSSASSVESQSASCVRPVGEHLLQSQVIMADTMEVRRRARARSFQQRGLRPGSNGQQPYSALCVRPVGEHSPQGQNITMSMITKPEELVPCPYVKSHAIRKERLQFHLVKCEHANKNLKPELVSCPFNSTHKVPEKELKGHIAKCEDRGKVAIEVSSPSYAIVEVIVPASEIWDNLSGPTYKPSDVIYEKPVLLNLQGATPSERKAFRAKERRRLQEYQAQETKKADTDIATYVQRPNGIPKA